MSTERKPLLSSDAIEAYADNWNEGVRGITIAHRTALVEGMDRARTIYEAARAKDAELIQQLVDCVRFNYGRDPYDTYELARYYAYGGKTQHEILEIAKDAGFTPTPESK